MIASSRNWLLVALTAAAFLAAGRGARADAPPAPQADAADSATLLARFESEDRRLAAAHFATARSLYRRGDAEGALRQYQRAARSCPPLAEEAQREAVPLALSLSRPEEAVRYAIKLPSDAPHAHAVIDDPVLLRRLALMAAERREWRHAALLYRALSARFVDATPGSKPSADDQAGRLMLRIEWARAEYLSGDPAAATHAFEAPLAALRRPGGAGDRLGRALGAGLTATWQLIGVCALESGAHADAQYAFERLAEDPSEAPRAKFWLARTAEARGAPLAALDALAGAIDGAAGGLGLSPYELYGQLHRRLGGPQRELAALGRLAQRRPNDPLAQIVWGDALRRSDEADRAIAAYRSVVTPLVDSDPMTRLTQDRPANPLDDAALAEGADRLIETLASGGKAAELFELVARLAERTLSLDEHAAAIEKALAADGRDALRQRLIERLDRVAPPDWSDAQLTAARRLSASLERHDIASSCWQETCERLLPSNADVPADEEPTPEVRLALLPAAEAALEWGFDMLIAEQYEAAQRAFAWGESHRVWGASDSGPLQYQATALAMLGRTEEALVAARRASRQQPEVVEFAARPAWIFQHAGRHDEAIAEYQELVGRFANDRDAATRQTLKDSRLALSALLAQEGDYAAAAEELQRVLDEFPESPGASNDLAYLWSEAPADASRINGEGRGARLASALRLARAAVASRPSSAAYHDTLGWVLFRLGDQQAAIDELRRAVELADAEGDPDGVLHDHLGDALAQGGQDESARRAWRQAIELLEESDPEMAEAVRAKLP
ncbi:tetratricopeptide repeat protein [Pseudobythopirellula maris]|uniref:tetratricopeptide repeat protein n=1 Tax=Pseudobythopirellula maris TaxID=2527991 RepID=UPI0011B4240D|nr:tetratricopeptide repeat protein [Pseudobythopirellula maris]